MVYRVPLTRTHVMKKKRVEEMWGFFTEASARTVSAAVRQEMYASLVDELAIPSGELKGFQDTRRKIHERLKVETKLAEAEEKSIVVGALVFVSVPTYNLWGIVTSFHRTGMAQVHLEDGRSVSFNPFCLDLKQTKSV